MDFDKTKYPALGTAVLNKPTLKAFIESERIAAGHKDGSTWISRLWQDYFYKKQDNGITSAAKNLFDGKPDEAAVQQLLELDVYASQYNQPFLYHYSDDTVTVISAGSLTVGLPTGCVSVTPYPDYSAYKSSELAALTDSTSGPAIVPGSDISMDDLQDSVKNLKSRINDEQEAIYAENRKMKAEIEAMKAEIQKKYQEKMDLIAQKKQELDEKLKELNKQVFLLDTQLYGIRCFLGETVKFARLTTGKYSDPSEPVILYQKLRFLDEEMAKYVALYDFNGDDIHLFEDVLKYREDIRDLFAPGPKSITLVRVSRDRVEYGSNPEIANILKAYEVCHGGRIGILVRDGENLSVGWTEEERVSIQENMFHAPGRTEISDQKDADTVKSDSKETIASRYFIFQILQGLLSDKSLIRLPEQASVYKPSPYIVFSMADGWIPDSRFGDFSDILKETDKPLKKGDYILTTIAITRDDHYAGTAYKPWHNDRGRGEKNRTRDASIPNRAVIPVNCIDKIDTYLVTCDIIKWAEADDGSGKPVPTDEVIGEREFRFSVTNDIYTSNYPSFRGMSPQQILDAINEFSHRWDGTVCYYHCNNDQNASYKAKRIELRATEYEYYVSAKKTDSNWNGKGRDSFANLEIREGEYINLTYLNSVYIRYAIANRQANEVRIASHTVNYKTMIPYLQTALRYLDEREQAEAAMLKPYMELYPDWQVDLSRWRMENNYHTLTPTRAKKFASEYKK